MTRFTKHLRVFAVFLCALGLVALYFPRFRDFLDQQDNMFSDWRAALEAHSSSSPHPDIVIVAIDKETLGRDVYPIPRDFVAKIITAVGKAEPGIIGVDLHFSQAQGDLSHDRSNNEA